MFGCPLTESDDYREAVFNMLPNLKYLDGQDHDGNEKPDDDDDEDDEDSGEEDGEEEEDGDSLLEDSEQEGLGEFFRCVASRTAQHCSAPVPRDVHIITHLPCVLSHR